MSNNKTITNYINKYSELDAQQLTLNQFDKKQYKNVVVIPICNEDNDCLKEIFKNIVEPNVLIIIVLNSPQNNNKNWQTSNNKFYDYWQKQAKSIRNITQNANLLSFNCFNDVLIIDRNRDGLQLNSKQAVGMARKIGCDIALQLSQCEIIEHNWIYSTDADVILPKNYFQIDFAAFNKYAAIVLDFQHISNDKELRELQFLYDLKMYYYRAGVSYAACNYAYIPLGSTLIINGLAYAQVRGFPKKNAAEDFYLLNKLAKVAAIKYRINDTIIQIHSRFSNRVPFGTGPALQAIKQLKSTSDYLFYHPQCFILLRQWNKYLNSLWQGKLYIKPPDKPELLALFEHLACQQTFEKSKKQITSQQRWSQFIHQWFDAFRILKAIHFFDKKFPRLPHKQLLNHSLFAKVNDPLLQHYINTYYGLTLHT
ncbi:MAG TPA: hypothetical protein ENJ44_06565 [Oceanospirillales bacterium]|nr:hypothetical protein [Oceanospirillales bacterium]